MNVGEDFFHLAMTLLMFLFGIIKFVFIVLIGYWLLVGLGTAFIIACVVFFILKVMKQG